MRAAWRLGEGDDYAAGDGVAARNTYNQRAGEWDGEGESGASEAGGGRPEAGVGEADGEWGAADASGASADAGVVSAAGGVRVSAARKDVLRGGGCAVQGADGGKASA